MKSIRCFVLVAFGCGLTLAQPVAARATDKVSPPNVILILTDDQGYGDLSLHGNDKLATPVMDRLAGQSTRFDRFFVSPLCTPTRACLMTGRYYLRTGAVSVTRGLETLRPQEVTIAEVLKSAGYATGCFGKWHLGEHFPSHPNGQGFDEFFGMPTGHWDNYFDPVLEHNGQPVQTRGYITDVLTDAAIEFIEEHREEPFFCYVPYNAPHTPLQISDTYFDKYKALGLDDRVAAIYGMVQNIDENLGRLLQRVDELSLARRTIVFFLSDNGPEGPQGSRYNAGMRGMKGQVHEGGVRVPLFVRWPGKIAAGRVLAPIAAHIDLLPTIAEMCGVVVPETLALDGRSLAPLLLGQQAASPRTKSGTRGPQDRLQNQLRTDADEKKADCWPERMIFTRMPGWRRMVSYVEPVITDLQPLPAAVRTQRWRLTNLGTSWELYDMIADPGQVHDVAAQHPEVVGRLLKAYEKWFADVTQVPIERPAIPIGYHERPAVELPAPEAYLHGKIRWYNKYGFAHDWLTGWTDPSDSVSWELQAVRAGTYKVTVMYACPPEAVGTRLRVEVADASVEGSIDRPHDSQPVLRPSRQRKMRYTQTFARLELGQIALAAGRTRLTLKALSKPADQVCDVKSVWLQRIE